MTALAVQCAAVSTQRSRTSTPLQIAARAAALETRTIALEYAEGTTLEPDKILAGWQASGAATLYRAKGCKDCDHTGYKGRAAVYELLVADAAVKRLVQSRSPVTEVAAAAMAAGMRTLKQDGIDKVLQGLTDLAQVRAL